MDPDHLGFTELFLMLMIALLSCLPQISGGKFKESRYHQMLWHCISFNKLDLENHFGGYVSISWYFKLSIYFKDRLTLRISLKYDHIMRCYPGLISANFYSLQGWSGGRGGAAVLQTGLHTGGLEGALLQSQPRASWHKHQRYAALQTMHYWKHADIRFTG